MKNLNGGLAKDSETDPSKKKWVEMKLTYVGHVGEVLRGGGGKLSATGTDPGESRKTPGQG